MYTIILLALVDHHTGYLGYLSTYNMPMGVNQYRWWWVWGFVANDNDNGMAVTVIEDWF